jgi:hypothetical protein
MKSTILSIKGLEQNTTPETAFKAFEADLQAAAVKWFKKPGHPVRKDMDYCISEPNLWHHNIILPEVARLIQITASTWKRRLPGVASRFEGTLHHGLSNHAMAFNLLGPLVVRKDLAPIKAAFQAVGGWGGYWDELYAYFEAHDRKVFNELEGVPACLDFAIEGNGNGIFADVLFTQSGFTGCPHIQDGSCDGKNPCSFGKLTECALTRSGNTLWTRMEQWAMSEATRIDGDTCPFVNYYSFFQNLLFSLVNDRVYILIYDERNSLFVQRDEKGNLVDGLCQQLSEALPRHKWTRVGAFTIQDLVRAIEKTGRHGDWIQEFKDKYAIK